MATAVVPIAYAVDDNQHYNDLVHYKGRYSAPLAQLRLSTIAELFIREHLPCLHRALGGVHGGIAVVPSTRGGNSRMLVTVRDTGCTRPNTASSPLTGSLLTCRTAAGGLGVLLFDDTWVTGARVQSAAHALLAAGAPNVVSIVVGRFVRRSWTPAKPFLDRVDAWRFDTSTCAICRP